MNIPENLPYKGQVEACINEKTSFQTLIKQLKDLNSNNAAIINYSLLTEEDLKILTPVKNNEGEMIGIELAKETDVNSKLDRLSENLKAVTKIKILENWLKKNELL